MFLDIKVELHDLLEYLFTADLMANGGDYNSSRSFGEYLYVSVADRLPNGETRQTNHYFDRDKMAYHGARYIHYNGNQIAISQQKPHKVILLYKPKQETRYVYNLLLRMLHDEQPKVKVMCVRVKKDVVRNTTQGLTYVTLQDQITRMNDLQIW